MIDQENSTDSNLLSLERTHMAIERTYYSVLRSGLAIAAAGTIIVRILGEQWPDWLSYLLCGVFIAVGIITMLSRY